MVNYIHSYIDNNNLRKLTTFLCLKCICICVTDLYGVLKYEYKICV